MLITFARHKVSMQHGERLDVTKVNGKMCEYFLCSWWAVTTLGA